MTQQPHIRRSFSHTPQGGWSSIALHLSAAEAGKEGFYLTLFPDGRGPSTVFLSTRQMQEVLELALNGAATDQQVWDYVAKIPLEPLLPSRTLSGRLRTLLADCVAPIREELRLQSERRPPAPPVDAAQEQEASLESEPMSSQLPPKPNW
jgi:hypothetical protein